MCKNHILFKMKLNIMHILSDIDKVLHSKLELTELDFLVSDAVRYIYHFPHCLDVQMAMSERDCVLKVMSILDSSDGYKLKGPAFLEYFNYSCTGVDDPKMRDLLANLMLWTFDTRDQQEQYLRDIGLMDPSETVIIIKTPSSSSASSSVSASASASSLASASSSASSLASAASSASSLVSDSASASSLTSASSSSLTSTSVSTSSSTSSVNQLMSSSMGQLVPCNAYSDNDLSQITPSQMGLLVRTQFDLVPRYLDLELSSQPYQTCESTSEMCIVQQQQQQKPICYDLTQIAVYSLIGLSGNYLIKDYTTGRLSFDERNSDVSVPQSKKGILLRLSEVGFFHNKLKLHSDLGLDMGFISSAFMLKLRIEINDYNGRVAEMQDAVNAFRKSQLLSYMDRNQKWKNRTLRPYNFTKLISWYLKPLHRLQWLYNLAKNGYLKKGGELLTLIHGYIATGNPITMKVTNCVLIESCIPLVRMISKWMFEGELSDVYNEFFIASDPDIAADRMWHHKFRLRLEMLPNFISPELSNKILKTGKSIYFLREICQTNQLELKEMEQLRYVIENNASEVFKSVTDTEWHQAIETCYIQTSKYAMDQMVGPHKLLIHLHGMRRYLLLGAGDFVNLFIENIKEELQKIGAEINEMPDLTSTLDTALRFTNAKFDDPDILNHLHVVVRTPYEGDCGWDVISLQYRVEGPLSTMLEPVIPIYKTLFKPLWRMKHMEFVLTTKIWKEQMHNSKALRDLSSEINNVTYKLHLLTSELMHFLHEMLYYVLFEVIECNWVRLQHRIAKCTDLDQILKEHSNYLDKIADGCFMSSQRNEENHLQFVYDRIISMVRLQEYFYDNCFAELNARKTLTQAIEDSEKLGLYGITTAQMLNRENERKIFHQKIATFDEYLDQSAESYAKAIGIFLLELNCSINPDVRQFGSRLDFNEFYKKRDANISKPLTFEHMRMSNVLGSMGPSGTRPRV